MRADSGVLAENAVITTGNKALFFERPGSRELTVRPMPLQLCWLRIPSELSRMQPNLRAWYDLSTNTYTRYAVTDNMYGSAATQLLDDTVLVVGGTDFNTTALNATASLGR